MPWLGAITAVGLVLLVGLVVLLLRIRTRDLVDEYVKRRGASSRLSTRADYVEGMERIPVALALTADTIYYENPDLQASIDLARIDEIEYDDETATGQNVDGKVVRVRSHGHAFEFVVDVESGRRWEAALPTHHVDDTGKVRAS